MPMAATTRRPYADIHAHPLPLSTHPLPAFLPHNPLSLLRLAYAFLTTILYSPTSHDQIYHGYYSPSTRAIHITDPIAVRALWEKGFFGKGSLSRSEPEWLDRERARLEKRAREGRRENGSAKETAGEVTNRRREERKKEKRERARKEAEELEEQLRREGKIEVPANGSDTGESHATTQMEGKAGQAEGRLEDGHVTSIKSTVEVITRQEELKDSTERQPTEKLDSEDAATLQNQEHLQLTPEEAFFLSYGLGCLKVHKPPNPSISPNIPPPLTYTNKQLLELFMSASSVCNTPSTTSPDNPFLLNYIVYHHFRSFGWVVRPGIKFAVDFLLYARGPVFAHAEFAVLVLPSYSHPYWTERDSQGRLKAKRNAEEKQQWWWLHNANRVQNQVRKSLVLVWVEIPPPAASEAFSARADSREDGEKGVDIASALRRYQVREFVISRWTANRQR